MAYILLRGFSARIFPHVSLSLIVLLVVMSGCRSYGGQGSEEAKFQELQRVHGAFEEMLVRKQAELGALQQESSDDPRLARLIEQYEKVVLLQEMFVIDHSETIAGLSAESDYRHLHRVFGAIIAKQRIVEMQYQGILDHAYRSFVSSDTAISSERPYALIPPYYDRIQKGQRQRTLGDVLAAAGSAGPLDESLARPDADTSSGVQAAVPDGDGQSDSGDGGELPVEESESASDGDQGSVLEGEPESVPEG